MTATEVANKIVEQWADGLGNENVFLGRQLDALKSNISTAITNARKEGRLEVDTEIVVWISTQGYATGHGDTTGDLLDEFWAAAKEKLNRAAFK